MSNLEKYLNQDIDNPVYMFHGSSEKLNKLVPMQSHDSNNNQNNIDNAIFLFPSFIKSTPYAFMKKIIDDNDFHDFEVPNKNEDKIMIIRNTENIDENITGYIHVFKKDNTMIKDEKSYQYRCYHELTPIDIIEVKLKDYLNYIEIKERITLDDFVLNEYDFSDENHIMLKNKLINSKNSELISSNINQFIERNYLLNKEDKITNTYVISYDNNYIGLSFINFHPEIERDGRVLNEEIEIGVGIIDEFRGHHLGTLIEKELSRYLLKRYPQFNEIVARIDSDNLCSKNAAINAGFEYIGNDEFHFKRK